ncbi:uncharacterized protein LOC130674543 [Microplitis mediator]|uniref:uncharacterized protein LOC130674543 n=1 Tax=Microplitis mediator TaxID=375433 RepID=UPI0025531A70|nr:uncharacterized protein LOC130674543 [Microplitis mediator]
MSRLGKISSMQRMIQRVRSEKIPKVEGKTLHDLTLPDELKLTEKNKTFLQYDSGQNNNRFMIFTTYANLMKLSQCEIWAGDGTFRSVPVLFKQLYSLHGVIDGHTLPLVYMLSSRKSKTVYRQILQKIKELLPDNIMLRRMLTDYELSFVNAFKNVFIDVHVSGCFFHYTQ